MFSGVKMLVTCTTKQHATPQLVGFVQGFVVAFQGLTVVVNCN